MNEKVASVAPDDSVREADQKMEERGYSQLPVLTAGLPVGSISFSDIRHAQTDDTDVGDMAVREVMSEQFPTVSRDATVEKVDSLLDYYKAVMVTEAGEAMGIVTEADIATARS